jgi:mono/diheme cytochrome c family protein
MPYGNFRNMSDEDIASVVVYLRSLPPVKHAVPRSHLPFMLKHMVNLAPKPLTGPVPEPDRSNRAAYGKYLATSVGDCDGCHTPRDEKGNALPGMDFGGGNIFTESGQPVASANITPDPSGISYYDEAQFLETIHTGTVKGRKLNVMMPWWNYKNLTDDDLKSIFAFLRTLKPAKHRVDNTETPTKCRIDGNMHGLGDKN